MKYLKFTHKHKSKHETKYIHAKGIKEIKYDHKSKYLEIEIDHAHEAGFVKPLNLSDFEMFLVSDSPSIFSLDFYETEDEAC